MFLLKNGTYQTKKNAVPNPGKNAFIILHTLLSLTVEKKNVPEVLRFKVGVSWDFLTFCFFYETNPPGPVINRLKWFSWKIRFRGDIRKISYAQSQTLLRLTLRGVKLFILPNISENLRPTCWLLWKIGNPKLTNTVHGACAVCGFELRTS